jgi:glutamate dehydrogenase (NAD(P)+)
MTIVAQDHRTALDHAAVRRAEAVPFRSVDGWLVLDLPYAQTSGGGTRLASDVDRREVALLARAMTYKLASLGLRVGGAKIGLRARPQDREAVLARFRAEIAPRLASGQVMTGPDLGTSAEDFRELPMPGESDGIAARTIDGVPAEEYLTGFAAAVAVEAALGQEPCALAGRSVALEGFGKVGSGLAREIANRGGRIVALSTIAGCVLAPEGGELPVPHLLEARAQWGDDDLVHHLGLHVHPREALWRVEVDVLVPGARPGVIDARNAAALRARTVVPFANAPYTLRGLSTLAARTIPAHADFIASAGGAIAYLHPEVAQAGSTLAAVRALERRMFALVRGAVSEAVTPYAGAASIARRFLRSWIPDHAPLPAPPLLGTLARRHGA